MALTLAPRGESPTSPTFVAQPVTDDASVPEQPTSSAVTKRGGLRVWGLAFRRARFRRLFVVCIAFCAISFQLLIQSLHMAEARRGVVLDDPILPFLPVADLSIPIFVIEYGAAVALIYFLRTCPYRLVVAFLTYGAAMLLRWMAISLVPLEPPPDLVLLVDPVVSAVGGGPEFTKDLFFSGHTAAMSVFALTAPWRRQRWVFWCLTVVIGVMLMIQRVHYSVDVFVAPVMAYLAWRIARMSARWLLAPRR